MMKTKQITPELCKTCPVAKKCPLACKFNVVNDEVFYCPRFSHLNKSRNYLFLSGTRVKKLSRVHLN